MIDERELILLKAETSLASKRSHGKPTSLSQSVSLSVFH
jgi:hypothetical protein